MLELHEFKLFDAYCVHTKLARWHILLVVQFATLMLNILITEMIYDYVTQIYSLIFSSWTRLDTSLQDPFNQRLVGKNGYSLIDRQVVAGGCCQSIWS